MGKGKRPLCYLFFFPLPIEQRGRFFPSSQLPYATQKAPAEKTKEFLALEPQVIEAGQILSFDNRGRLGNKKSKKMYMINRVSIRAPYSPFTESTVSVLGQEGIKLFKR